MAKEEPLAIEPSPPSTYGVRIRRAVVESVEIYEIKDTELEQLESGSPADIQLNFAIFLLSSAFSALIALVTATFSNSRTETAFQVVFAVGLILGTYFLIAWWRNRKSMRDVCHRVRLRMPPNGSSRSGEGVPAMPPERPKG